MKSRRLAVAAVLLLLTLCTSHARAFNLIGERPVLGKRHVGFSLGGFLPGDEGARDILDLGLAVAGHFVLPVHPNLDLTSNVSHTRLSGEGLGAELDFNATELDVGARGHFRPGGTWDPFVHGSVGFLRGDVDVRGVFGKVEGEGTNPTYRFGGGVEIALDERLTLSPSLTWVDVDFTDDVVFGFLVHNWVSEQLGIGAGFDVGASETDVLFQATASYAF